MSTNPTESVPPPSELLSDLELLERAERSLAKAHTRQGHPTSLEGSISESLEAIAASQLILARGEIARREFTARLAGNPAAPHIWWAHGPHGLHAFNWPVKPGESRIALCGGRCDAYHSGIPDGGQPINDGTDCAACADEVQQVRAIVARQARYRRV